MSKIRVAVVGAGTFGANHLRVIHEMPKAELVAVVDIDKDRAAAAAARYGCLALESVAALDGEVDAAVVATPTTTHAEIGCELLDRGIDVLVEKPIADSPAAGRKLAQTAARQGRILQVGHLERFNPAIIALEKIVTVPLFFEVHRLSVFTPRSLDVDVVLDLMIHDLDIVLAMVRRPLEEVRAAGISILSHKVDIANVRLAFQGGCIANLTASRVSTERVRKLRLFQPHQYVSLDYARQDAVAYTVSPSGGQQIDFRMLPVTKTEPLRVELEDFLESVESRRAPRVSGDQACAALEAAMSILDKIEEHSRLVAQTLSGDSATST